MGDVVAAAALVVAAVNTVAALVGGVCWWTVRPWRPFWWLVRAGQAVGIGLAALAGVAAASGFAPADALFWLYALLPVPIGLLAEMFRALSAREVLDAMGFDDAEAVGRLPADEQRSVVLAVVRREMGVMALAAGVVAFVALRAHGTA
jgi:hypothetical protein